MTLPPLEGILLSSARLPQSRDVLLTVSVDGLARIYRMPANTFEICKDTLSSSPDGNTRIIFRSYVVTQPAFGDHLYITSFLGVSQRNNEVSSG